MPDPTPRPKDPTKWWEAALGIGKRDFEWPTETLKAKAVEEPALTLGGLRGGYKTLAEAAKRYKPVPRPAAPEPAPEPGLQPGFRPFDVAAGLGRVVLSPFAGAKAGARETLLARPGAQLLAGKPIGPPKALEQAVGTAVTEALRGGEEMKEAAAGPPPRELAGIPKPSELVAEEMRVTGRVPTTYREAWKERGGVGEPPKWAEALFEIGTAGLVVLAPGAVKSLAARVARTGKMLPALRTTRTAAGRELLTREGKRIFVRAYRGGRAAGMDDNMAQIFGQRVARAAPGGVRIVPVYSGLPVPMGALGPEGLKIPALKTRILEAAGKAIEPTKAMTAAQLLRSALTYEAKGARVGYRAGTLDTTASVQEVAEYANAELPPELQNRVLRVIDKVRTPAGKRTVIRAINRIAAKYETASAVAEARQMLGKAKGLRPRDQAAVNALREEFALAKPTAKLRARAAHILRLAEKDVLRAMPTRQMERMWKVLQEAGRQPLREMEPEKIRGIAATLAEIMERTKKADALEASIRYAEYSRAEKSAITEIDKHWGKRREAPPGVTRPEKRMGGLRHWVGAGQATPDAAAIALFGSEDGAGYEILCKNFARGENVEANLELLGAESLQGGLKAAGMTPQDLLAGGFYNLPKNATRRLVGKALRLAAPRKLDIVTPTATTFAGTPVRRLSITPNEAMEIKLHWEDPETHDALLRNKQMGVTFGSTPRAGEVKLRPADFQAIANALDKDAPEWAVLGDFVRKDISTGPEILAVRKRYLRETGRALAEKENYWPRLRDADYQTVEPEKIIHLVHDRLLRRQALFLPRSKGAVAPIKIRGGVETYLTHRRFLRRYAAFSGPINDMNRLVGAIKFDKALKRNVRHPERVGERWKNLARIYSGADRPDQTGVQRFVKGAQRRAGAGALAANIPVAGMQAASYPLAAMYIDAPHLIAAPFTAAQNFRSNMQLLRKVSPRTHRRLGFAGSEILTAGTAGDDMLREVGLGKTLTDVYGYGLIRNVDHATIGSIVEAARRQSLGRGLTGEAFERDFADTVEKAVFRTQPAFNTLDTSENVLDARHNALQKLWQMFATPRVAMMNMLIREAGAGNKARFLKALGLVLTSTTAAYAISEAFWYGTARVAGVKKPRTLAQHGGRLANRVLGLWVGPSQFLGPAMVEVLRPLTKDKARWGATDILTGAIASGGRSAGAVVSGIDRLARGKDPSKQFKRATYDGLRAFSLLTGLPANNLWRYVQPFFEAPEKEKFDPWATYPKQEKT